MKAELLCAIQFLTRIPVARDCTWEVRTIGRSVLYYPLVGFLIGAFLLLCHGVISGWDSGLQAALLLTLWVLISGALHIDGLADLVDAWVGSHGDRERMLEIMKDPASGPMAVTAVVLLLLVKFTALSALLESGSGWLLLLVPMSGRAGMLAALRFIPYVRPQGLGSVMVMQLPQQTADRVLLIVGLVVLLISGWSGLLIVGISLGLFWGLRRFFLISLGGVTGDGIGAICELLEAGILLVLIATL